MATNNSDDVVFVEKRMGPNLIHEIQSRSPDCQQMLQYRPICFCQRRIELVWQGWISVKKTLLIANSIYTPSVYSPTPCYSLLVEITVITCP